MTAIITLTTDFGFGSAYLAAMKGVILGINPAGRLVDITHDVPAQDVRYGAVVLAEATPWFPPGTIHVAVVDPGVGTKRRLIYARIGDQQYLVPDNGLLSLLAKRARFVQILELTNSEHWMPAVSNTFHGRDILAPVAAQLTLGLESEQLGPAISDMMLLDWPEARRSGNRLEGAVQWVDGFGNLITNITVGMLAEAGPSSTLRIQCLGHEVVGLSQTYGACRAGELAALVSSSGALEIAVVNGNAARLLSAGAGTPVVVTW